MTRIKTKLKRKKTTYKETCCICGTEVQGEVKDLDKVFIHYWGSVKATKCPKCGSWVLIEPFEE